MDGAFASFETQLLKGRVAEAEALARHLLARFPDDERSHVALARVMAARGDVPGGVQHLRQLMEQHGALPFSQAWIAVLLAKTGDVKEAAHCAEAAYSDGARIPEALLIIAQARQSAGDAEGALAVLGDALEHSPSDAPSWRMLARVLIALRRTADAINALENAVAAAPSDVEAWRMLVQSHLALSDGAAASHALTRALALHPRQAELLSLAAEVRALATATREELASIVEDIRAHILHARLKEASALLSSTLAVHKPTRALRLLRVELECSAPDVDVKKRLVEVNSLLKEHPDAWEVQTLMARLLSRKSSVRNLQHALTHAEAGWRMSGGHGAAAVMLVTVSVATGRTGMAQAVCDQAKSASPRYAKLLEQALG